MHAFDKAFLVFTAMMLLSLTTCGVAVQWRIVEVAKIEAAK